jgi:hypothetical protein
MFYRTYDSTALREENWMFVRMRIFMKLFKKKKKNKAKFKKSEQLDLKSESWNAIATKHFQYNVRNHIKLRI